MGLKLALVHSVWYDIFHYLQLLKLADLHFESRPRSSSLVNKLFGFHHNSGVENKGFAELRTRPARVQFNAARHARSQMLEKNTNLAISKYHDRYRQNEQQAQVEDVMAP